MKSILLTLCFLSPGIIFLQLHAMNEDEIPLSTISQSSTSLKQRFLEFEKRTSIELHKSSWLGEEKFNPADYIAQLHAELPKIFTSERDIEKFSRIQGSYFATAIQGLITDQGYNHYKNVTGDTLATIHKPEILQHYPILDGLPPQLKQYVMRKAYYTIKENFVRLALNENSDILDIHSMIHAAAVINRNLKTFQIWNLKTGTLILKIPHASDTSLIRFSTDGSLIITTALFAQDIGKTCITLWNRETKKSVMQFTYNNLIQHVFFDNNFLHIFDRCGNVYIACIDIPHKKIFKVSQINGGIKKMNPPFTYPGKYCIDNNTILRKSFSYFLCSQAIKNTSTTDSLKKIYDTPFYNSDSLTRNQKIMLLNKIKNKINDLTQKNAQPHGIMSWFG